MEASTKAVEAAQAAEAELEPTPDDTPEAPTPQYTLPPEPETRNYSIPVDAPNEDEDPEVLEAERMAQAAAEAAQAALAAAKAAQEKSSRSSKTASRRQSPSS